MLTKRAKAYSSSGSVV